MKKVFRIPGNNEWGYDYISIDSRARRLYVSHNSQVEVLDSVSGKVVARILGTTGVHGIAIAPELKRGFTSNGGDASVTVFDTENSSTLGRIKVNSPDFILYDPYAKRVFPINEAITVIDAVTMTPISELRLDGSPSAAVSDARGRMYVNLAVGDRGAVAVVDTLSLKIVATFPVDSCPDPGTIELDAETQRLFISCDNRLKVIDAITGKVVANSLMCSGVDAAAFDPDRKLIFESCAEGVVSIIHEVSPNFCELVATVKTQLGARTMAFDPKTKNIFLPTADSVRIPSGDPNEPFTYRIMQGSFRVLVVGP